MKSKRIILCSLVLAGLSRPVHGATVTLTVADALDTSSFEAAGHWSDGVAPSAANDYVVPISRLRTPIGTGDHTFAGNSLKITTALGNLTFKGGSSQTITVPNLILDGGFIDHLNAATQVFTLAGGLTVTGTGSRIAATQGPVNVTAAISGSGDLAVINNLGVTFSGVNPFTGNLTLNGPFTLAETGILTFKVGADGVNNTITGTSTAAFNGAFTIDLTGASTTIGHRWTLVNVGTLTETFGSTFSVAGFTEYEGIWTDPTGKYQFKESSGVLTVIASDSDGDGLADSWEMSHFGSLEYTGNDDYDGDIATNLLEFEGGTNPKDATKFPDTDKDGLNDGWELFFFKTLAQGANDDFDDDFADNLSEYLAQSDPTGAYSYPDNDQDEINDGWEIHYFGTVGACDPVVDKDGDLFSNREEFEAGTDPIVQVSSPDTDLDGLPDGWEVKYFRVGTDDLVTTLARHNGTSDADADGYDNLTEFRLGTIPSDVTSVPGPVAWWHFGEATTGAVPGDEGGGVYTAVVLDSTVNGNAMRTWNAQTAPGYATDVPFATVPVSGAANPSSLYFDAGADGSWSDVIWTDTIAPMRTLPLTGWTVELSFKMDVAATGGNQAMFSKDGNPLGNQPLFHLKYLAATGKFEVGLIDGTGTSRYLTSNSTISTGQWYSVAVTANSTTLSLWIKKPGDAAYVLEGTLPIEGAFHNTYAGFNDAWAAGRARWNGGETDWFKGWLDEIRVSAGVLDSSKFIASSSSTVGDSDGDGMNDAWETTWFGGVGQAAAGDFDGDGTSNLTEYRLGLIPNNGSSRFSANRGATGALTWPSAVGLTFIVQRSPSLAAGSWETLATVTGTAGTATYTDPALLPGHAFYRIFLAP